MIEGTNKETEVMEQIGVWPEGQATKKTVIETMSSEAIATQEQITHSREGAEVIFHTTLKETIIQGQEKKQAEEQITVEGEDHTKILEEEITDMTQMPIICGNKIGMKAEKDRTTNNPQQTDKVAHRNDKPRETVDMTEAGKGQAVRKKERTKEMADMLKAWKGQKLAMV